MHSEQDYRQAAALAQAAYAQGNAQNYAGMQYADTATQKGQQSFTEQVCDRLNSLQSTLAEVYESISNLSERVLGPQPSPVVQGAQAGPSNPPSMSVSILAQLELLNTGAAELARRASVLNHRI